MRLIPLPYLQPTLSCSSERCQSADHTTCWRCRPRLPEPFVDIRWIIPKRFIDTFPAQCPEVACWMDPVHLPASVSGERGPVVRWWDPSFDCRDRVAALESIQSTEARIQHHQAELGFYETDETTRRELLTKRGFCQNVEHWRQVLWELDRLMKRYDLTLADAFSLMRGEMSVITKSRVSEEAVQVDRESAVRHGRGQLREPALVRKEKIDTPRKKTDAISLRDGSRSS